MPDEEPKKSEIDLNEVPDAKTGLTIGELQEAAMKLLEERKKRAQRPVTKIAVLFGLIGAVPVLISKFIARKKYMKTAARFHQHTLHLDSVVVKRAQRAKTGKHHIQLNREPA